MLQIGRALPFETKAAGDEWTVQGYLSTFHNTDAGGDLILPTAFDKTLASGRRVKFLFAHDDTKPLGPPLDLRVDDHGLFASGRLSKTQLGADVHTWLLDGAVDSWSIGYWPTSFEFKEGADGELTRVLKSVDLLEGSLVPVPMNEEALVTAVKGYGLSSSEHAARVVTAVQEFLARARAGSARRALEGRGLSPERIAELAQVSGSLQEAVTALGALCEEPRKGYAPRLALRARVLRHAGHLEYTP